LSRPALCCSGTSHYALLEVLRAAAARTAKPSQYFGKPLLTKPCISPNVRLVLSEHVNQGSKTGATEARKLQLALAEGHVVPVFASIAWSNQNWDLHVCASRTSFACTVYFSCRSSSMDEAEDAASCTFSWIAPELAGCTCKRPSTPPLSSRQFSRAANEKIVHVRLLLVYHTGQPSRPMI
jgi:hypothetical protein